MVAILHDGINLYRLFTSVTNALTSGEEGRGVSLIYTQTLDFWDKNILASPGLANILRRLTPRPIKYDSTFISYLKNFTLVDREWPDFELALFISQTIKILQGGELEDFYNELRENLKLKINVLPLLNSAPNIKIKVKEAEEELVLLDYFGLEKIGEVLEIKSEPKSEKLRLGEGSSKAIQRAKFILLFQLSPITLYFLSSNSFLKEIFERHSGHIAYIMPHELSLGDRKIVEKYYDAEIAELIKKLEDTIDIVIFDKNFYKLVNRLGDVDLTLYPLSFEDGKSTDYKKSVDEIVKIIESEI